MRLLRDFVSSFLVLASLSACNIHPHAWTPEKAPSLPVGTEVLTQSTAIDLLGYYGAEDFAVDSEGNIYCGSHKGESDFSSGAILKISPDGKVLPWVKTAAWVTGVEFDQEGRLLAMLHGVGLVRFNSKNSVDTLVTHTPNGAPLLMGAGMRQGVDGKIYFTNLSDRDQTSDQTIDKLFLELRPQGGVYVFNPDTGEVETLREESYFPNGLALSKEEDYLLVSETSKYRILRYWLKGEQKGQWEVFMDNLPGFPNNISPRSNGNFWLGFTTKRNADLDKLHSKPFMKKVVYNLPNFLKPAPEAFGMLMEVSDEGQIIRTFLDSSGSQVAEAGAILEKEGTLYLGGDKVSYVSKLNEF